MLREHCVPSTDTNNILGTDTTHTIMELTFLKEGRDF